MGVVGFCPWLSPAFRDGVGLEGRCHTGCDRGLRNFGDSGRRPPPHRSLAAEEGEPPPRGKPDLRPEAAAEGDTAAAAAAAEGVVGIAPEEEEGRRSSAWRGEGGATAAAAVVARSARMLAMEASMSCMTSGAEVMHGLPAGGGQGMNRGVAAEDQEMHGAGAAAGCKRHIVPCSAVSFSRSQNI